MCQQEEAEAKPAGEGTGEDLSHPSAYKKETALPAVSLIRGDSLRGDSFVEIAF